uniref:Ankyrin-1 n=1 Tax=Magallana gigas TaxID=29159 RepID=K1PPT3_MAGGI
MSNSKFKLTGENTNLARVAQMILGPCTNVLRDVLRKEISPSNLETKVKGYIAKTKKPLINQQQETLVYSKDYLKFDVTLLYFLLRNMCSIQPHSNKWGNNPQPGDRSVSGNIERIRLIRNEYGHYSERSISDIDFKIKYKYIKGIVRELENYLGSSTKYQDEVKELKTCAMDPTQSEKNIKELLDLHEKIKDISVIYGEDVQKWKEDDSFFVETHNFQAMLDKVRQQPFVSFVGVPGSGKTTTARHIALLLQEKDGYEILPTKDIKDIETYCDPRNPQVFVIDDVLGVFGFDMKELEKLTNYKERLNKPPMPETKVLMTCREVVFKHEAFSGSILSNKKHVVQLHSEENALNDQDKYDLFAKYNLDKDLLSADTLSNISKSFPYLCKLFSRKEALGHYGQQFFISPIPCILELLDIMKIRNKDQYASLVLLMTNQNSLSEKDFNENMTYFGQMKLQVSKRCKVDPTTCSFYFIDALTEMEGTYTEQIQSEFKFIHDSMLEIIAYHFGRHFPELILQYMDSDYIANYIKPSEYKCMKRKREEDELEQTVDAKEDSDTVADEEYVHDLCIKLQESHYHLLADRLFEDIHKGELFNVFENEALKNPLVLQHFLDLMNSKPYSELFTVFLSELKEQQVKQVKTSKKHFYSSKSYGLLMKSKWINKVGFYTYTRAIDWVIFYGHNQILQFIIDQIIKNTNTVYDLFRTPFNIRSDDLCTTVQGTDCNRRHESDIDENSAGRCDVSEDEPWSDLCSKRGDQFFGTEKVFFEKRRLLNLSCYSGDLLTFQTLLRYRDNDVLFSDLSWIDDNFGYGDNAWKIHDPPIVVASKTGHLNILLELLKLREYVNDDSYCDKSLVVACSKGHLDIVIALLKRKANVNITDYNGTPLIAACINGHLDVVLELLRHGADVNIKVFDESPLSTACSVGHLDIVLELLKHGADVNIKVSHNSPLIAACLLGHLDIVLELLKHGADVNITGFYNSPLIAACTKGHLDVVLELLKHGAEVNSTGSGTSPLISACSEGYLDIVLQLLKHGAYVDVKSFFETPLIAACSINCILKGNNLLRHGKGVDTGYLIDISNYAECSKVQLDMIRELLKHKADVNIKTCRSSPLIAACSNEFINDGVVRDLLKHGADVNLTNTCCSPLIAACRTGRFDVVLELLKYGADVNITIFHDSPLIAACATGHKSLDIMTELLKHGADVNMIDSGKLPLIIACKEGHLDVARVLLKHGADVNAMVSNNSPLLEACSKGHLSIVHELLKHGADVNMIVSDKSPHIARTEEDLYIICEVLNHGTDVNAIVSNNSPLLEACLKGHLNVVHELLKHGADANLRVSDNSPLIAACSNGYLDVINELLKHGADVNIRVSDYSPLIAACSKGHLNIVLELLKHEADVNIKVSHNSPLIAACSKGHLNIVLELLKHEADVNIKVSHNSPLIAACSEGHLDIVLELLKHEADVNIKVSDISPLIAACSKGHLDIVLELLKHEADVNIKVSDNSPLIAACSKGHLNIVLELLKHEADVNIKVSHNSPLIAACSEGHLDIVLELLKHEADVNIKVSDISPLIAACSKGHLDIVLELLKHEADVNIKVSDDSPLIAACSKGHLDIVLELLKHEADVNIKVSDMSPLIAACSKGHRDIVLELLKHETDVNIKVSDDSPLIAAC